MPKIIPLFTALCILLLACAGSGASAKKDAREADDAAMDALIAMDNGGSYPGDASAGAGGNAPSQNSGARTQSSGTARAKPDWVDTPSSVYSRSRYISVVGYGSDRNQAERDALAKLIGVFGQSVQAELKTISSYSEAVKSGVIQVTENSAVQNAITTSAEMDSLVGAEIADVWFDGKNVHYAAAVMEREKTSALYADIIQSNERLTGVLVNMTPAEKNSLEGYSRYLLAATIADANRIYANVLTVVGNTRGINPAAMKKGDDYRIEAAAVVRNIPIGIAVSGDQGDRIKNALAKALNGAGFRSGGDNSRYMIQAAFTMTPVELPGQQNKFVRYQLNCGLTDTAEGDSVLVSYDASGREGHLTISNAEERALRAAENKIPGEFENVLKNYLSSLAAFLK